MHSHLRSGWLPRAGSPPRRRGGSRPALPAAGAMPAEGSRLPAQLLPLPLQRPAPLPSQSGDLGSATGARGRNTERAIWAGLIASDVRCALPSRTQAEFSAWAVLSSLETKICPNNFPGSSLDEKGEPLVNIKEDVGFFLCSGQQQTHHHCSVQKYPEHPTPFSSQSSSRCGFSALSWLGGSLHHRLASDPIYLVKEMLSESLAALGMKQESHHRQNGSGIGADTVEPTPTWTHLGRGSFSPGVCLVHFL